MAKSKTDERVHTLWCKRLGAIAAASVCAMAVALEPGSRSAAAQEVDFKGKQINVIVGYAAGGGTDAVARLLGHYMRGHLPGNPTMVYRNMPAGRGTTAAEFVAQKTPKDGLHWYAGANSVLDANMLLRKEVTYDPRTFNYFGGFDRSGSIIMMRQEKLANLKDRSTAPVIIGTPDGSETWGELLLWGQQYLGWNIKFVLGYPGTSSLVLAIQQGEIDAFGTSVATVIDELLTRQKGYVGFTQVGTLRDGKVISRVGFETVPTIADEMAGKLSAGLAQQTFDYWIKTNVLDKWFFVAPGTPEPIVKAYLEAFEKTSKDTEFMERGRKQFGPDFGAQSAAEIAEMVALTAYPDEKVLNFLRDMKVKGGLPTEPLTQEERDRLLSKLGPGVTGEKIKTQLTDVKDGGRVIEFMAGQTKQSLRVSSSETKVMIAGQSAARDSLKSGMACEVTYMPNGGDATAINC